MSGKGSERPTYAARYRRWAKASIVVRLGMSSVRYPWRGFHFDIDVTEYGGGTGSTSVWYFRLEFGPGHGLSWPRFLWLSSGPPYRYHVYIKSLLHPVTTQQIDALWFFRNTSSTGHCHEVVPVLNRRNNVDITIAVEAKILLSPLAGTLSYCRLAIVHNETLSLKGFGMTCVYFSNLCTQISRVCCIGFIT